MKPIGILSPLLAVVYRSTTEQLNNSLWCQKFVFIFETEKLNITCNFNIL